MTAVQYISKIEENIQNYRKKLLQSDLNVFII